MTSPSDTWLERARRIMPWGSSTCSKAPRYRPEEPAAIVSGKGCRVWDADGRAYIDFRNALGPISLGYRFPAIDNAIREQLDNGIIFGHPSPLECEVAEMICDLIPCAERARFLKTGGEAIAACIRLARACTRREHVIQIGYNGWLNSLAAGGRLLPGQTAAGTAPAGVPACLSALHHTCGWNDADGLRRLFAEAGAQIAAVVVAANLADIEQGKLFYPLLRRLTREHGAVLIFDEIVTGFRVAVGGVQDHFGVTPDLAVFAKGIANGMPLSVYTGSRAVMACCETGGAVISSTYGGEALSLAAAKAALSVYRAEDVIGHLWRQGERLAQGLRRLLRERGLPLELKGFPPCLHMTFDPQGPAQLQESFFRAAYRNGVSLYDVIYINYSHQAADIDETLERLAKAVKEVAKAGFARNPEVRGRSSEVSKAPGALGEGGLRPP
ncbi:MAG: aminotransferase class III-fold pyridoxal phosphate-dependent enzyme [Kiritimatiellae bacterium]|nr:aminotransferase class III-fold pyridoxal phosphate-dependent enzyme [Kiritimatiellia bacterium]